jgi:predicted nucleotidyltransferase
MKMTVNNAMKERGHDLRLCSDRHTRKTPDDKLAWLEWDELSERGKACLSQVLEGEDVRCAFVYGSIARGEQGASSDIDLMVIGYATLDRMVSALRVAEQELGRQINALLYTVEDWLTRRRDETPFITGVMADKKIFIRGTNDELESMGGR